MFYIIGIGLSKNQITLDAINAIKNSDEIYIDNYTNILSEGYLEEIEKVIKKKIIKLNREELEQEKKYIKNKSALLVIGNPTSATTHYSLISELKLKNIKYKIIPGISIFNYRGFFGLSEYKFGKTVSIVFPEKNYFPTSFYDGILDNLKINLHTLCLLDIKVLENKFMSVFQACEILQNIDKKKILKDKTCVGLFKMGSKEEKIIVFTFKDYKQINLNLKPQSLIICSDLNDFEKECLNEYRL